MNDKNFKLTVSYYKILKTISDLNEMDQYPTAKGVNNILSAKTDEETKQFVNLSTYGTLISLSGRKLCSYILNMVRRDYLTYIYDENSDAMYLKITPKGITSLLSFNKRYKGEFHKKEKAIKHEIVYIKK